MCQWQVYDSLYIFGSISISIAGVLTIFYVVLLIVVEYAMGGHTPGSIKHKPEEWTDVFAVIPVICFGYQVRSVLVLVTIYVFFVSATCL